MKRRWRVGRAGKRIIIFDYMKDLFLNLCDDTVGILLNDRGDQLKELEN